MSQLVDFEYETMQLNSKVQLDLTLEDCKNIASELNQKACFIEEKIGTVNPKPTRERAEYLLTSMGTYFYVYFEDVIKDDVRIWPANASNYFNKDNINNYWQDGIHSDQFENFELELEWVKRSVRDSREMDNESKMILEMSIILFQTFAKFVQRVFEQGYFSTVESHVQHEHSDNIEDEGRNPVKTESNAGYDKQSSHFLYFDGR